MLWICVAAGHIYQQVTKKGAPCPAADPPLAPRQPLLRLYLIGGGVPFIICGVTAATNIQNYGKEDEGTAYCWMSWEPSLGAFYGPAAFTALLTCGLLLGGLVQLRRHPERRYELRAPTEPRRAGGTGPCLRVSPGAPPCPLAASLLQNEHSLAAQLRAAACTLFLSAATWAFGALAVSQEPVLDMVFSCLYGAFCVSLGLFVLIHHCAKREDVWHCWWACCPRRPPVPDAPGEAPPDAPGPARGRCKGRDVRATQGQARCLSPVTPCCGQLARETLLEDGTHLRLPGDTCDHGLRDHSLHLPGETCDHGLCDHGLHLPEDTCDHSLHLPGDTCDHGLCDHDLHLPEGLCDHGLCDHDLHLPGDTCDHGLCDHGLPLNGCLPPRTPPLGFFSRPRMAERDYGFHVQPGPDGSTPSSCSDSDPSSLACCALAEPFPLDARASRASPPPCGYAVGPPPLEMLHSTQPLAFRGLGQNGGLKGEVLGAERNIRTGPWRNETTV
ncbi:adhesion G protein-coupled receptor A1 isoform X2 [Erinaceus europaeus]|nr:adhesion G protein-coupled receptor A1 isoform X2 [Erinaceus europaeus]